MALRWKPRPFPFGPILSQSYCSLKRVESLATRAAQFEMKTGARDDLDLVHASKNGDVDAFEQLVSERSQVGTFSFGAYRPLTSPDLLDVRAASA